MNTTTKHLARTTKHRRHRRLLLAIAVVVALVAAACGDDGSSGTDDGASGDPTATFRWGADLALSKFDPHRATIGQDNVWLFLTYDRLIHQDPNGEPIPGLAESWEFDDAGTALTLKLRSGVTFHDGTAFDAEAVKANIERAQTLEDSSVKGDLATIESVDVVDDMTVVLNLSKPDAALPRRLTDRSGAMVSPAAFDSNLDTQPVGAGMYTVSDYVEGDRAVYQAYDGYWDPDAVKVASVEVFSILDPATRFNALKDGQLDATIVGATDADAAESAGFTVTPFESLEVWYLGLNSSKSSLGELEARQAISRGIDRQAIVDAVWFGLGKPTVQMYPEGYFAHDPDTTLDDWGYDPAAARDLLAEAGVPDGFSIEVIVPGPNPVPTIEAVQAQLKEIGVEMTLRQVEPTQAATVYSINGEGDAIIGPWSGRPDPTQTSGILHVKGGFFNVSDESTPDIERLYADGLATFDEDKRAEIMQDLSAEITRAAFTIPLFFPQRPLTSSEKVGGLEPYFSGKMEFRGVTVSS